MGELDFVEFGSTIFGCIEGIAFCQAMLNRYGHPTSTRTDAVQWHGVDVSTRFNELAKLLHQNYPITTYTEMPIQDRFHVFFAKGVSLLYQIRCAQELAAFLNTSKISVFDYTFAMAGEQKAELGTGKEVVYLDVNTGLAEMRASGGKLMARRGRSGVRRDMDRFTMDVVFGDPTTVDAFMRIDAKFRATIKLGAGRSPLAHIMLPMDDGAAAWITIEEALDQELPID